MSYTSTLPTLSGVIASTDQIDWSNPVAVTDTANLNFGKHHVVTVTAADKTLTLPAVSGNGGKMLSIEIAASTTKLITIDGNASETIDGATTRIMWASETCILLCNGTSWTKIAGKSIPMMFDSLGVDQTNITGDGTYCTLIYNAGQNDCSAYSNATGYYTVKRPGVYQFNMSGFIGGITASQSSLQFGFYISSIATYRWHSVFNCATNTGGYILLAGSITTRMAIGDYIYCSGVVYGSSKVVDQIGGHGVFSGTEII